MYVMNGRQYVLVAAAGSVAAGRGAARSFPALRTDGLGGVRAAGAAVGYRPINVLIR